MRSLCNATLLESTRFDAAPRAGVARPGWIELQFAGASPIAGQTRTLRVPPSPDAGHSVPLQSALELREDVSAFLLETGMLSVDASGRE